MPRDLLALVWPRGADLENRAKCGKNDTPSGAIGKTFETVQLIVQRLHDSVALSFISSRFSEPQNESIVPTPFQRGRPGTSVRLIFADS